MNTIVKVELTDICVGISHHISNYHAIVKYCYENNLKLIKPLFKLTATHNNDKLIISDLSMYYDLDNITVNNNIFKVYDQEGENNITIIIPLSELLRRSPPFNTIKKNYNVSFPYNKSVLEIANNIVAKIGTEFMCIHVRRGDRIRNEQMNIDTQPPNILSIIKKNNASTVYIMTNRIKELVGLRNNKEHTIYFFDDFEELKSIEDNYYLFSIECAIMNIASIKCSTFNTQNNKYNCYLTNHGGSQ